MARDAILIRGVSESLRERLTQLAIVHNRSLEGEARHALQTWGHQASEAASSQRCREVASRLHYALEQAISPRTRPMRLTPSALAERIGEDGASSAEAWFQGAQEPTFKQLDSISRELGVSSSWLKHGDGSAYYFADDCYVRFGDLDEDSTWLLGLGEVQRAISVLRFVRSEGRDGRLVVIKEWHDRTARTYNTDLHVSDMTGAGGRSDLMVMVALFRLLDRAKRTAYGRSSSLPQIYSYVIPERQLSDLQDRRINPLTIIEEFPMKAWWEDIWDTPGTDYWPGFTSLCRSIAADIESSSFMPQIIATIEDGTHSFLQKLRG